MCQICYTLYGERYMSIESITVGVLSENCYLIGINDEYLLIDPGDDVEKVLQFIKGKKILGILVTHYHFDHVGSLDYLKQKFHYPVFDKYSFEEGIQHIGCFSFEVIYTPGHKEDSVSYYFPSDKVMFTGDFLFLDSIGRCDLKGGDELEMARSLLKIKKYNDDIMIYPGHGDKGILGIIKKINPYLKDEG